MDGSDRYAERIRELGGRQEIARVATRNAPGRASPTGQVVEDVAVAVEGLAVHDPHGQAGRRQLLGGLVWSARERHADLVEREERVGVEPRAEKCPERRGPTGCHG